MVITCPYQIKALRHLNLDKSIENIEKYLLVDWPYIKQKSLEKIKTIEGSSGALNVVFLYGFSQTEEDIQFIAHPLVNLEKRYIVCDLRPYIKVNKLEGKYEPKNELEYESVITRAILTAVFSTGNEDSLRVLKLPQKAYATWLSDNLSKRFGLNMSEYNMIYTLGLIFYNQLFTNDPIAKTKEDIFQFIRSDLFVSELYHDTIKRITKLDTIEDFCASLYSVTSNPRLQNVDYSVLTNLVVNNWFGLNSKEMMILSLEHPPTWITIFNSSLENKSYKNSYISKIAEKVNKKGAGDIFTKQLKLLVSEYKS